MRVSLVLKKNIFSKIECSRHWVTVIIHFVSVTADQIRSIEQTDTAIFNSRNYMFS